MPLYEYECKKCGQVFEVMQKFSDEPVKKHPGCGGKVDRLLSAPGIHFKGTGWYITDYARGGGSDRQERTKSEEAAKKAESSTTSTSTDSGTKKDTASKSAAEKPAATKAKKKKD